jgi:hypothetical protein
MRQEVIRTAMMAQGWRAMGSTATKSNREKSEAMGTQGGKSDKNIVYATKIVEELKQASKGLKRFLPLPNQPLLPLHDKVICGKLDLKGLTIDKPLEITCCCFEDEIDLRYCEFKQLVDFSGCTFRKEFNSGDATHSLTIYRKDLVCNRSRFESAAYFNGMHVEGDAYFEDSCFELEGLEKPPDSQLGSKYTVDFTEAHFGHQLVCHRSTFKGPVTFNAVNCDGSGSFDGCRFITRTRFEDKPEIDFNWASFERNLWCQDAEYTANVNFRSVKCGYNAFFKRTLFDEEADLRFLELSRNLDLRWTYWAKRAKLGQIQVSKKLRLGGACFQDAVELYDSRIGVLELWDPNPPEGEAIRVRPPTGEALEEVVVGEKQDKLQELERRLNQTERLASRFVRRIRKVAPFSRDAKDRSGAEEEELIDKLFRAEEEELIDKLFPFKLRHKQYSAGLNLTGTTFERFHGGPTDRLTQKLALRLADMQDPTKFSIDPYLQLRNHYLKIGDESRAKEMRLRGFEALRENAWASEGRTNWTLKRWLAEYLLYWPTSYGYRVWHVLLPALLLFFVVGTISFWPADALTPTSPEIRDPRESPFLNKALERSIFSLDLLIPALDLRYEAMWMPKQLYGLAYAVIHSILGWVLIALLLAWLTGVIKPRD